MEKIKKMRKDLKLTQQQFAVKIGVFQLTRLREARQQLTWVRRRLHGFN